jgi:hypothetical protein
MGKSEKMEILQIVNFQWSPVIEPCPRFWGSVAIMYSQKTYVFSLKI